LHIIAVVKSFQIDRKLKFHDMHTPNFYCSKVVS
jgi:hypothetical protein